MLKALIQSLAFVAVVAGSGVAFGKSADLESSCEQIVIEAPEVSKNSDADPNGLIRYREVSPYRGARNEGLSFRNMGFMGFTFSSTIAAGLVEVYYDQYRKEFDAAQKLSGDSSLQ